MAKMWGLINLIFLPDLSLINIDWIMTNQDQSYCSLLPILVISNRASSVRACSHEAKVGAKAKKIKEPINIEKQFSFCFRSRSVVNGTLAVLGKLLVVFLLKKRQI